MEFGAQHAAPGAPAEFAYLYGVIRYRDNLDGIRDYDLFFSPTLAIWQLRRYELDDVTYGQYVGGFHYDNCQDGFVTATDRVFMPAFGLHPQYMHDANDLSWNINTAVRTNYGCQNSHYSNPWPIDNYQGAGSGNGDLPPIVSGPDWTPATQTLHSVSLPLPWVYYPGVLDPFSAEFLNDFNNYSPPLSSARRAFIQSQVSDALANVRLENQIRILPDGTIMLTHIWTDLKGRPWTPLSTDGYWLPPDSAPNGRVFYFDTTTNDYEEPFAGGANPAGFNLLTGNGWVGYFVDQVRPDFGIGFYYDEQAGGIAIFPADNWPGSPAVAHTDYWTSISLLGRAFRQMFMVIGTKEEMQAKVAILDDYVKLVSAGPPTVESFCEDGIDDDHNGLTDCADPECFSPACNEICSDGWDNDSDGDVDCADADCSDDPTCRHPDFDRDGDVDQADFGHLQACFTESVVDPIGPGCEDTDLDSDTHVDSDDLAVLQGCSSGANVPYAAGCKE